LRPPVFPDRRTRRIRSMRLISSGLALALAAGACASRHTTLPAEPGVTLAAHRDGDGFVIDRLPDGATGLLVARGRLHAEDAPDLTLEVRGERRAGLWMVGASRVLVREDASTRAPRIGEVLSTWDGRAIRLAIYDRDGSMLRTDVFRRSDGGPGAPVLAREEPRATELEGTYRAAVRDAHETAVGWMRVQIRPTEDTSRIYDAVFPTAVDGALAAGAVAALDTEVTWLEDHSRPEGGP
jgi:hypothetical protein